MNTYKIIGKMWSLKKGWYNWDIEHRYPTFQAKKEKSFTIKANSLNEAYRKMILLHPFWAVGCSIICEENDDFLFDAVFDYYYGIGLKNIFAINHHNLKQVNHQRCQEVSRIA